ncbi:hypothetical protein KUCAC02_019574 [Chaenocephalus aceratus]|uniref:Uncharacterized protein n=1 Tax=Chaenocephalus aceratus TaxID=36190 RepID=A0ACB9VP08_CHAAC|nr:hypothetical protein KUCAC02_019574 [Chaenocephalus aceratus]
MGAQATQSAHRGLCIAAVSSAWRSLAPLQPLSSTSPTAHARAPPSPLDPYTLRHGCPAVPRPGGLLFLGAVKEEKEKGKEKESWPGLLMDLGKAQVTHAVILRIQGRRQPCPCQRA